MEKHVLIGLYLNFCLEEQKNLQDEVNLLKTQLEDRIMADKKKVMKAHILSSFSIHMTTTSPPTHTHNPSKPFLFS